MEINFDLVVAQLKCGAIRFVKLERIKCDICLLLFLTLFERTSVLDIISILYQIVEINEIFALASTRHIASDITSKFQNSQATRAMLVPARVTVLLTHRPSYLMLNVGMVRHVQIVLLVVKRNRKRPGVVSLKMACVVMMENIAVLQVYVP